MAGQPASRVGKVKKVMRKFYWKGLMLVLQYSEPNADLTKLINPGPPG